MNSQSTTHPILWGAYLACSWTWCIGMFLPALLLRDMGWPGYLIFALPNIAGAAAMGWVLTSRKQSIQFVEKNEVAIWWFSAVTLAFHLFWIFWVLNFIKTAFQLPTSNFIVLLGAGGAFVFLLRQALKKGRTPQLALLLFLFSFSVLVATYLLPDTQISNANLISSTQNIKIPLQMLPVMIFGFLLCPYLDITFHHARQQLDTRQQGRRGFTIGFVAFFSFMILLTTRYAGVMTGAMDGTPFTPIASRWLSIALLIHILFQWIFTVRVHLDRIQTLPFNTKKQPLLLGLLICAGIIGYFATQLPSYAGLTGGEIIYRIFLSAYGLIFPTYMLYRVLIDRQKSSPLEHKTLLITIFAAFPFFGMGFINRQTFWLIPGLSIIFIGALLLKRRNKTQNT